MEFDAVERRIADSRLAIDGGAKVRARPMPLRHAFGEAERAMLAEVIAFYDEQGVDPGYQGPFEKRYTDDFVETMGGGYADAVATGTGSVYLAVAALNLPKGSEVIVSPITDPGTIGAITLNGLTPRLADARPYDYNMTSEQFLARATPNVSGVVVVHSCGRATDIDRIVDEAHRRGIRVVEDCSQAHGAQLRGRPVGTFGDIAAFSTMYRKIHMTGGCGGVVYTRDLEVFRNALAHADRGKPRWRDEFDDRNPEHFLFPALNWNANELGCAIGIASLRRLKSTIVRRLAFVSELASLMAEMETMFSVDGWSPSDSPFILPVYVDPERSTRSKLEVADAVRAEGVDLNPHYRYVVAQWPWLKPYLADDFACPQAAWNRDNSFCLYLNENYGEEEAADVAAALLKVHRSFASSAGGRKIIPVRAA